MLQGVTLKAHFLSGPFFMAINRCMRVYTLIDITETKRHRNNSNDKLSVNQQANFMTFVQTLMLGTNFYFETPQQQTMTEAELKELGFGSDYKGKHSVWYLDLKVDEAHTFPDPKTLLENFDLVPVIPGLNETIEINNNVFRTQGKIKNIVITNTTIEANIT